MSGPNDFDAIRTAVLAQTQDNGVIIAMLVGAGLESNWNINAPGGGAFQIIDAARPSPGFTLIPSGVNQIDYDVGYMLPRYQAASAAHAKDAESSNKYANIAHDAERPAQPYQQAQGQAKVDSVYHTVVVNYGMGGGSAGGPDSVVSTNPFQAAIQPFVDFISRLTDVRMWRSIGWLGLGVALIVLALIVWFRKPLEKAATVAAKAAVK
jgi:hypothetical protein